MLNPSQAKVPISSLQSERGSLIVFVQSVQDSLVRIRLSHRDLVADMSLLSPDVSVTHAERWERKVGKVGWVRLVKLVKLDGV